jgi:putative cardiolipin synthase
VRERNFDIDVQDVAGGSSSASLHAKTFASDGNQIFIGSFNFDPRSVLLNCEMGMMIDSPRMATRMAEGFDRSLALAAYRPQLRDGQLVWLETLPDGSEIVHTTEPGTTRIQRVFLRLVGYLPIEWLL